MSILTRDNFLKASPRKAEKVEVPALGGEVYVRQITVGERDEFERMCRKAKIEDIKGGRALIVALVTVDEDGEPLFGPEDLDSIAGLPASVLEPIINAHVEINDFSSEDMRALAKN